MFYRKTDFFNTNSFNDKLLPFDIIEKSTILEVYYNQYGYDSNIPKGYSVFIEITKNIEFIDLIKILETDSGLSFSKSQIEILGNGNFEYGTKLRYI